MSHPGALSTQLSVQRDLPHSSWHATEAEPVDTEVSLEALLEDGAVLRFTQLPFALQANEHQLLNAGSADGLAKNISLRWPHGDAAPRLRGAAGTAEQLEAMQAMIARFAEHSEALVTRLFAHYAGHLRRGNSSFRPLPIGSRVTSWRQDDTRLHVDAFPSNPTGGKRLLRVFSNINPNGEPRAWRTGEHFETFAKRYLPQLHRSLPGSATVLHSLHITKARRTEYDHVTLRLHDLAKADLRYQREAPQAHYRFMPGTTWICFTDQVLHAAMSGQHLLEQTFVLEPENMRRPKNRAAAHARAAAWAPPGRSVSVVLRK